MIKPTTFAAVLSLATVGWTLPSQAQSNPIQQLLKTRTCQRCNLSRQDLSYQDLSQVNLQGANLTGTDLRGANLTGANLSDANLRGAKLESAVLNQTDLTNANLEQTRLADAIAQSDEIDLAPVPNNSGESAEQIEEDVDSGEDTDSGEIESDDAIESETASEPEGLLTPLLNQQFQQPTAQTLPQGTVTFKAATRLYSLSDDAAGDNDTPFYPHLGFSVGITDDLELTAAYQQVDSNSPGRQGPFIVTRGGADPGNDELTLQLKQKIWKNADRSLELSGVAAVSFAPTARQNTFVNGVTVRQENSAVVPGLQLPFTATVGERTKLTLSPTIAFFPSSSALFLSTPPIANPGSFGTTFGLTGAASFNVFERLTLWADAFVPFTGNNSISPTSGRPNKEIAFNAGLRYLVNPRLALDVFATNTQGSVGPLALTTQPDSIGVGANLVFMPDFIPGNRKIADNHNGELGQPNSPRTIDGLGFFDGGTVPKGKFAFHLQGGSQGILTALRFGFLKDFEGGIYLDSISGQIDESEQGISGKVRLLNQDRGAPFTLSLAGTLSQTNDVFANFVNNDRTAFNALGIDEGFPFIGNRDRENRLFIVTLSLPAHYRISDRANVWFTPTIGVVQRNGVEAAGFNVGGEFQVIPAFSVLAEVGADFVGRGNAFSGNRLVDRIPWNLAVRVDPLRLFGAGGDTPRANRPNLELFVTNRVGSSPWHQLRVRDQSDIAVGAGILIPF